MCTIPFVYTFVSREIRRSNVWKHGLGIRLGTVHDETSKRSVRWAGIQPKKQAIHYTPIIHSRCPNPLKRDNIRPAIVEISRRVKLVQLLRSAPMKRMDPRGSAHLSSVYSASLTSRQRVNKQSVRERHMLEPWFVYTNSSVCRWSESGSRHRLLFSAAPDPLLAADNFFSPFPPSTTRLSFRLNPLPLSSLPPLYHLPPPRGFIYPSLCQQLKDFFDKSSAHTSIPPPLACASPAIRFEEIDSSPVYDVLSNRVNTEKPSSSLKLDVSPHCAHLYCFPHVTYPAGIVAETESVSATWSHTTCGFLWDKGPLDNRGIL